MIQSSDILLWGLTTRSGSACPEYLTTKTAQLLKICLLIQYTIRGSVYWISLSIKIVSSKIRKRQKTASSTSTANEVYLQQRMKYIFDDGWSISSTTIPLIDLSVSNFCSEKKRVFFEKDWNPLRNGLTLNQYIIELTSDKKSIWKRRKSPISINCW